MGLIKAALGAFSGTMADQWKEYFYCDSLPNDVLMRRGKRQGGKYSGNNGNENVITSGSGIAVADGQCMIIVESGKIVEVCTEPGRFTYDASTEPSLFSAPNLKEGIVTAFETMGKRFTYGGAVGNDQRIYYFNMKELMDNKFGTPTPIPFRIVDENIGLDLDTTVRCNGVYSYKIVNPLPFYVNLCGNVTYEYTRDELDSQLKTEFIGALQPAFAKISGMGVRPSALPAHSELLAEAMNEALTKKWAHRGLAIGTVAIGSVSIPPEDAEMLKNAQREGMYRRQGMSMQEIRQMDVMKTAAANESGSMNAFMGMGMAGMMFQQPMYQQPQQGQQPMPGGYTQQQVNQMYQPGQMQQAAPGAKAGESWVCSCGATASGNFCMECGSKKPAPKPAADSWTCSCGAVNTGKFCMECGTPKPVQPEGWTCSCGTVNKGKFCMECGSPKPAGAKLYRCDKCGWEPKDPANPPKFCPECGDIFDDKDVK